MSSSPTSFIECRWCGVFKPLGYLRKWCGERAPRCVGRRTWAWMQEHEYVVAGKYLAPLDQAGVLKHVPMYIWWSDPVYGEPDEDGILERVGWARHDLVTYEPVAPRWAWQLARELSENQDAIARVGGFRREKRDAFGAWARQNQAQVQTSGPSGRKRYVEKLMLPVAVRAGVIRRAAQSPMARELIGDDLETALRIIRDVG